jgi:hypothetical protein
MKIAVKLSAQAPAATIRPEIRLLLHCARTGVDSARTAQMRTLLRGDIDWQYLIRMAHAQGMMPLLHRSLHTGCPEAVPKVISDQLQRHFYTNAFHNRFLTKALLKILNFFEAQGIPCIPYKGPSLAAAAYGDLSLRQFGDLDLLIHPKDIQRAKGLLISQGYRLELTGAQEAAYLQFHYHLGFTRADSRVTVELHWGFTWKHWSFPFDFACLWARLIPVSLEGTTTRGLSPEDLLLILCVHGAKHGWERLMWICDVAELVRAYQRMNWERLLEQANSLGSKRILFLGLFLANDLLGAELPEEIWQSIQADSRIQWLAGQVSGPLLAGADSVISDDDRPAFARTTFYLTMRERLRDKVQFLVRYPFRHYLPAFRERLLRLLLKRHLGS